MKISETKKITWKAFNGMCLVIIQSTENPGEIILKATSPDLEGSTITIDTNEGL